MDIIYIYGPQKKDIGEGTYIFWEYPDSSSSGSAETDSNNGIITQIFLKIDQTRPNLNLSEIIDAYGYPDYVLPLRFHYYTYQVDLIYQEGLAIDLMLAAESGKFEVLPDSEIESVWFFSNGIMGYKDLVGDLDIDYSISLKPWNGYTKYDYP